MFILIFSLVLLIASVFLFIKFDNSTDILSEIKNTINLWLLFWLGFIIEFGLDYFFKWKNGSKSEAVIPESYWLLLQFVLAIAVSYMVYKKLPKNKSSIFKMFLISIQVLVNFIVYLFILVSYILESGLGTI